MKREIKIMLAALSVLAISVPSILVLSSLTQSFIFTKSLHVTDFVKSEDAYIDNVTDSGRIIAHINVRIESPQPNSSRIPLTVSIWHTDDTELDSLSLRFTTKPYAALLFLEAPSYDWPVEYRQDGEGILFSVKDLGWYGESTITLNFILDPPPQCNTLSLAMGFSMHYSGFMQLTSLKGHSYLNTEIR